MENESKIPILAIVGPTASGKTELGIYLAKKFCGEIISADSMQIYKEFEVSTAKPKLTEREKISHHLIDVLSVEEEYSVSKFVNEAKEIIFKIKSENKIPILVGGTGLYVDSLLKNIDFGELPELKSDSHIKYEKLSNEKLFENLKKIDPVSIEKIHINDRKRLIRANQFFEDFGFPISEQTENSKKVISPFESIKIGINFKNRELLYERINNRVNKMIEDGLVQEIERVSKISLSKTAKFAIGYKEILEYINGEITLNEATEKLKMVTRRYAKRQLTWFRRDKNIKWFFVDNYKNFEELKLEAGEYVCSKLLKPKKQNKKK